MNDEYPNDATIRLTALDRAIAAECGKSYTEDGNLIVDFNRILSAAKAFEDYLKGTKNV